MVPAVAAYVALLRGIAPTNPKMHGAELRRVFESLSFEHVRTVISSGNVVFETGGRSSAKLESRIEAAMHDHLGSPCTTIVRTRSEMERLSQLDVFAGHDDGPTDRCNVTFLKREPASSVLPETGPGSEILAVRDQAVFSVIDTTAAKTPDLMRKIEAAYGKDSTTRTWKTVHRIVKAFDR